MKRHLRGVLGVLVLGGCAVSAPPAKPVPAVAPALAVAMQNGDFGADFPPTLHCPLKWGCSMHSNARSYRFFADDRPAPGKRSICIERLVDEPWAVASQGLSDPQLRGKRLRLSLQLRTEAVEVGAGPWVLVQGGSGNTILHDERLVKGTTSWQRHEIEFTVPTMASVVEVGATLQGPGRACFGDVRLEALPP